MATQLPHTFETKQQYERSLRMPIGPEWSTKETVQNATKPRIMIKQGVIKPMEKPMVWILSEFSHHTLSLFRDDCYQHEWAFLTHFITRQYFNRVYFVLISSFETIPCWWCGLSVYTCIMAFIGVYRVITKNHTLGPQIHPSLLGSSSQLIFCHVHFE